MDIKLKKILKRITTIIITFVIIVTTQGCASTETKIENGNNASIILLGLIFIIIIAIIYLYDKYKYHKKLMKQREEYFSQIKDLKYSYNQEIQELEFAYDLEYEKFKLLRKQDVTKIFELTTESEKAHKDFNDYKEKTEKELETLRLQLSILEGKYEKAKILHPNLDDSVNELLESEYKAEAQKIDEDIAEVFGIVPTKDNANVFELAITKIESAEQCIRKYIASDLSRLIEMYNEAVSLNNEELERLRIQKEEMDKETANKAYQRMKNIFVKHSAIIPDNLSALEEIDDIYQSLTESEKRFFPDVRFIARYQDTLEKISINYFK